jgi:hypothetical protein
LGEQAAGDLGATRIGGAMIARLPWASVKVVSLYMDQLKNESARGATMARRNKENTKNKPVLFVIPSSVRASAFLSIDEGAT